tara:strand:+ start:1241 stop:1687 length:447 start_codon:yes stop_codon:yes gene_type:complete
MPDHVREQIRSRIVTNVTGLSTTGSRVFESRIYPLESSELPGLLVYTISEESEPIRIGPNRLLERVLNVVVQAYCESNSDFDGTIDEICKEVETSLASDRTVNGLAKDLFIASTEITYSSEGAKPVGYATMVFTVDYYTDAQSPDVAR